MYIYKFELYKEFLKKVENLTLNYEYFLFI